MFWSQQVGDLYFLFSSLDDWQLCFSRNPEFKLTGFPYPTNDSVLLDTVEYFITYKFKEFDFVKFGDEAAIFGYVINRIPQPSSNASLEIRPFYSQIK